MSGISGVPNPLSVGLQRPSARAAAPSPPSGNATHERVAAPREPQPAAKSDLPPEKQVKPVEDTHAMQEVESLLQRLQQLDPLMASNLQALLALLYRQNPAAAHALGATIRVTVSHLEMQQRFDPAAAGPGSAGVRPEGPEPAV
jgi:hypothetical protein